MTASAHNGAQGRPQRQYELVQALADQQAVDLCERDLALFEDLIVNERTCVVLRRAQDVLGPAHRDLADGILPLAVRYEFCAIIIDGAGTNADYELCNALAALHATLVHLSPTFRPRIFFVYGPKQTADLIRRLADAAVAVSMSSAGLSSDDAYQREWLTERASLVRRVRTPRTPHATAPLTRAGPQHERLLTSMPALNSFAAQMLLSCTDLASIARCTTGEQLLALCPWLPFPTTRRLAKALHHGEPNLGPGDGHDSDTAQQPPPPPPTQGHYADAATAYEGSRTGLLGLDKRQVADDGQTHLCAVPPQATDRRRRA